MPDKRFRNSLACALDLTKGHVAILEKDGEGKERFIFFPPQKTCAKCQISLPDLTPNMFRSTVRTAPARAARV